MVRQVSQSKENKKEKGILTRKHGTYMNGTVFLYNLIIARRVFVNRSLSTCFNPIGDFGLVTLQDPNAPKPGIWFRSSFHLDLGSLGGKCS